MRLISLCLFAMLVSAVSSLAAQAPAVLSPGEQHIREGIERRQQGDDAAALVLFEEAWRLEPTPRARAQMALCEYALSRWLAAEEHLREALAEENDPWIIRSRETLDTAYARILLHVATVEVRGPEGAWVSVSGREYHLPMTSPAYAEAGDIDVQVQAAGYENYMTTVSIFGGQSRVMDVTNSLVLRVSPQGEPDVPSQPSIVEEPLFWIIAGGVVLLAAGTVATVVLVSNYNPGTEPAPNPASGISVQALRF